MSVARPVLRYHGGKWRLAPWIISHFPAHRVYVEPYGGACSVLMRKPRSYAEVYNDLDSEVVNVFRVLQDPEQSLRLRELLELTPFAREEFDISYEPANDLIEQARRTIVRSFMGFGTPSVSGHKTGFRSDSNRSGTTPARDWRNYPAHLPAFVQRLRGVSIEKRNAFEVIGQFDTAECLFYVDPPYVHATRANGNPRCKKDTYRHELSDDDHRKLAAVLHNLEGMVVLSGYPSELYEELYCDWRTFDREAQADGARPRTERLWLNAACANQRSLFAGEAS